MKILELEVYIKVVYILLYAFFNNDVVNIIDF